MATWLSNSGKSTNGGDAAWPLIGQAVRTAQQLGLHRDGLIWDGLTPGEANERRRVFYEVRVCLLSLLSTLALTLPFYAAPDAGLRVRRHDLAQHGPPAQRHGLHDGRPPARRCSGRVRVPRPAGASSSPSSRADVSPPADANLNPCRSPQYKLVQQLARVNDEQIRVTPSSHRTVMEIDHGLRECESAPVRPVRSLRRADSRLASARSTLRHAPAAVRADVRPSGRAAVRVLAISAAPRAAGPDRRASSPARPPGRSRSMSTTRRSSSSRTRCSCTSCVLLTVSSYRALLANGRLVIPPAPARRPAAPSPRLLCAGDPRPPGRAPQVALPGELPRRDRVLTRASPTPHLR